MPGPTLTASEFAMVTGMTRDRLRTWERRFGWPCPERAAGGPRRYRAEDAQRVVAVRRLHEGGMPLDRAITEQSDPPAGSIAASTWRSLVDELPLPLVVLSGPLPLAIEYVNATLRERPDGPRPGDVLEDIAPWFSDEEAEDLRSVFSGDARLTRCAHPDWTSGLSRTAHSLAVRVPQTVRSRPLVALMSLDAGAQRQAGVERARLRQERVRLHAATEELQRWCATSREVAELTVQPGMRAVRGALHALRRRVDAGDAALYIQGDGQTYLLTSVRGNFAAVGDASVPHVHARFREVNRHVWVPPGAAGALGAPRGHGATLVGAPMTGGRRAVVALASEAPLGLGNGERELLEVCAHQVARAVVVPE
ncbi:MAG: MerR family transcriptional regulator [Solirubrobacteraceae bacterium]